MGRGLSELQKRILVYARDAYRGPRGCEPGGAPWFDALRPSGKVGIGEAVLPGKWGEWTQSDIAVVSRALARLERRGLVVRVRNTGSKRRTMEIVLTPRGEEVMAQLDAAPDS
jgi:hypothetical protein